MTSRNRGLREAEGSEPGNEVDSCQDAQPNVAISGIITTTSVNAVINAIVYLCSYFILYIIFKHADLCQIRKVMTMKK